QIANLTGLVRGSVYTQVVDGATGARLLPRKQINSTDLEAGLEEFGGLAIDPDGRFVLETVALTCDTKTFFGFQFQALDSTGAASGDPILMTDCDFIFSSGVGITFGLDVMKVQ